LIVFVKNGKILQVFRNCFPSNSFRSGAGRIRTVFSRISIRARILVKVSVSTGSRSGSQNTALYHMSTSFYLPLTVNCRDSRRKKNFLQRSCVFMRLTVFTTVLIQTIDEKIHRQIPLYHFKLSMFLFCYCSQKQAELRPTPLDSV
jgi:hypothetical protein